jgi:hypothetical protein
MSRGAAAVYIPLPGLSALYFNNISTITGFDICKWNASYRNNFLFNVHLLMAETCRRYINYYILISSVFAEHRIKLDKDYFPYPCEEWALPWDA